MVERLLRKVLSAHDYLVYDPTLPMVEPARDEPELLSMPLFTSQFKTFLR